MTTVHDLMAMVNGHLKTEALRLASHDSLKVTYTPTGLLPMDILLQGGMPSGRFVELYGDYSTLKSYIGLCIIREYQKRGKMCAVIDTERTFDPDWAKQVGVNVDNLLIWPDREDGAIHTGEEAIDVTQALVAGGVDFVLFDSVAAAFPQAEAAKRLRDENIQPARLAMLMSQACRRLTATNSHTAILWINQTRINIGITFGSNEAIPGGKALGFYSSYRVSMRKVGKITRDEKQFDGEKWTNGKVQIGQKFRAEVTKSKLSRPFRDILFTWNLSLGELDIVAFLIAQGIEIGAITQKGNTWTVGGIKAVGREKFYAALTVNQKEREALENLIRTHHEIPLLGSTSPGRRAPGKRKVLRRSGR